MLGISNPKYNLIAMKKLSKKNAKLSNHDVASKVGKNHSEMQLQIVEEREGEVASEEVTEKAVGAVMGEKAEQQIIVRRDEIGQMAAEAEMVEEKKQIQGGEGTVDEMTRFSIDAMRQANSAVENLAKARAENKLSNSRVVSVSRELKELIKVMSLYSY